MFDNATCGLSPLASRCTSPTSQHVSCHIIIIITTIIIILYCSPNSILESYVVSVIKAEADPGMGARSARHPMSLAQYHSMYAVGIHSAKGQLKLVYAVKIGVTSGC